MFKKGDKQFKKKDNRKAKETFGLSIKQLRQWSEERMNSELETEFLKQEIAVSRVREFLDTCATIVKLQSWWRMIVVRREFLRIKSERRAIKRKIYRSWKIFWKSEKAFKFHTFGKYFIEWKNEVQDEKRLNQIIRDFFLVCIKRMRLTPQACMIYFNPGNWRSQIDPAEITKIRRLMLIKLFQGWRAEVHDLKTMRFKASQILSRMVRRTKGPMWVKESTLVCFHMWYRYIKVKRCYRLGLLDPRFTNPHLPQWTKLYKTIAISRVKKKKTQELGILLTTTRAMRKWKIIMTIDRTKPVTPLAVAVAHYNKVLSQKILTEWFAMVRQRGQLVRYRDKLFNIWKAWAPKARKLRKFHTLATEWLRIQRQRKAFTYMTTICLKVIGKRTEKMKELRKNFCDRKVMLCAYAWMNKPEHVMMVDCWRRLTLYWRARRQWKSLRAHLSYDWHRTKAKVIFDAWKNQVKWRPSSASKEPKSSHHDIPKKETDEQKSQAGDNNEEEEEEEPMQTSYKPFANPMHNANATGLSYLMDKSQSILEAMQSLVQRHFINASQGELLKYKLSPDQYRFFYSVITKAYHRLPYLATTDHDPDDLYSIHVPHEAFPAVPTDTRAATAASNNNETLASFPSSPIPTRSNTAYTLSAESVNSNQTPTALNQYNREDSNLTTGGMTTTTMGAKTIFFAEEKNLSLVGIGKINNQRSETPERNDETPEALYQRLIARVSRNRKYNLRRELYRLSVQENLQKALDQLNLAQVIECLAQGALVLPNHIKQISCHVGDHIIPIFTLLVGHSFSYYTERIVYEDKLAIINSIHNPIMAFLVSNQLLRYERFELTIREQSTLTQDVLVVEETCGKFQSILLWRNSVIQFIDHKISDLEKKCLILPEDRTVDEEVVEVMKRKKIQQLIKLRFSLSKLLRLPMPWTLEDRINSLLPVVATIEQFYHYRKHSIMSLSKSFLQKVMPGYDMNLLHMMTSSANLQTESDGSNPATKSIYVVLREYNLLTGRLATEAKAIRLPWLERDQRLLINGFLKGARSDFLELRKLCMTPKQLQEEREKYLKIQKKLAQKEKAAEKKLKKKLSKAKKKKGKKKKGSKGKGKGGKGKKAKKGKLKKSKSSKSLGNTVGSTISDDDDLDNNAFLSDRSQASTDDGTDFDESHSEKSDFTSSDYTSATEDDNTIEAGGFGEMGGEINLGTVEANSVYNAFGAGGYSTYDVNDMNNNQIFNIKDLFNDLALPEEKEIFEEEDFQQRVTSYNLPIYTETWTPIIWFEFENQSEEEKYQLFLGLKPLPSTVTSTNNISTSGLGGEISAAKDPSSAVVNTLYTQRMLLDLKIIIRRLLYLFQQDETIGTISSYTECMNRYGGLSYYIIEKTLQDKCDRNDDQLTSPLWLTLPSNYWNIRGIKQRVIHEVSVMNSMLKEFRVVLSQKQEENDFLEASQKQYEKYLKQLRNQMILTIEKQKVKVISDVEQRNEKLRAIQNVEKQILRYKQHKNAIQIKLGKVDEKIEVKQYEYALFLLNPDAYPLPENYLEEIALLNAQAIEQQLRSSKSASVDSSDFSNRRQSLDAGGRPDSGKPDGSFSIAPPLSSPGAPQATPKKNNRKSRKKSLLTSSVLERQQQLEQQMNLIQPLLEAEHAMIKTIDGNMVDTEKKLLQLQFELKGYDHLVYRTNRLLKRFAEEKFSLIIDIQSLSKRTSKYLLSEETTSGTKQKLFRSYRKYYNKLKFFFDTTLSNKEKQLQQLAEQRKFAELMRVGGSGSDKEYGSPDDGRFSRSQSRSGSGHHNRRTKVVRGLSRGASKKQMLSPEEFMNSDFNFDILGSGGGITGIQEEVLHDAASLYGEESIDSNSFTVGSLPPTNEEKEVDDAEVAAKKAEEGVKLTVDEEIALISYNSPEAIAKREAELKALEEQQAVQTAKQELRMKVFDEYWQSFPRRELDENILSPRNEDDLSSLVDYSSKDSEEDLSKIVAGNRTKRMWHSISAQYWKDKALKMKKLIEKQRRAHNLEPEAIMHMVRLEKRDSIDPLDEAFNQFFILYAQDDIESRNSLDWSEYGKEKNKWYYEQLTRVLQKIEEEEEKKHKEDEEKLRREELKQATLKAIQENVAASGAGRFTNLIKPSAVAAVTKPKISLVESIWKQELPGNTSTKMSVSMKDPVIGMLASSTPASAGGRGQTPSSEISDHPKEAEIEGETEGADSRLQSPLIQSDTPRMAFTERVTKNDPFCSIGQAEFKRIKYGFMGKSIRYAESRAVASVGQGHESDEDFSFSKDSRLSIDDPMDETNVRSDHLEPDYNTPDATPTAKIAGSRSGSGKPKNSRHLKESTELNNLPDIREDVSVLSTASSIEHQQQVSEYLKLINSSIGDLNVSNSGIGIMAESPVLEGNERRTGKAGNLTLMSDTIDERDDEKEDDVSVLSGESLLKKSHVSTATPSKASPKKKVNSGKANKKDSSAFSPIISQKDNKDKDKEKDKKPTPQGRTVRFVSDIKTQSSTPRRSKEENKSGVDSSSLLPTPTKQPLSRQNSFNTSLKTKTIPSPTMKKSPSKGKFEKIDVVKAIEEVRKSDGSTPDIKNPVEDTEAKMITPSKDVRDSPSLYVPGTPMTDEDEIDENKIVDPRIVNTTPLSYPAQFSSPLLPLSVDTGSIPVQPMFPSTPTRSQLQRNNSEKHPYPLDRNDSYRAVQMKEGRWELQRSQSTRQTVSPPESPSSKFAISGKGHCYSQDEIDANLIDTSSVYGQLQAPAPKFILEGKGLKKTSHTDIDHVEHEQAASRDLRLVDQIGLGDDNSVGSKFSDGDRSFTSHSSEQSVFGEKKDIQDLIVDLKASGERILPKQPIKHDMFNPKITFFPPYFNKGENRDSSHLRVERSRSPSLERTVHSLSPIKTSYSVSKDFSHSEEGVIPQSRRHLPKDTVQVPNTPPVTPLAARLTATTDNAHYTPNINSISEVDDDISRAIGDKTIEDDKSGQYLMVTSQEYQKLRPSLEKAHEPSLLIQNTASLDLSHDVSPSMSLNRRLSSVNESGDSSLKPSALKKNLGAFALPHSPILNEVHGTLPPEEIETLQTELKKFLISREKERNKKPPSPGKLRINESKAGDMKEAVQKVSNFYELVVPTTSSKRYQRLFYDEKQRLTKQKEAAMATAVRSRASSHTSNRSNSDPLLPSGMSKTKMKYEVLRSSGTQDFWVNVAKVTPVGGGSIIETADMSNSVISGDSVIDNASQTYGIMTNDPLEIIEDKANIPTLYHHSLKDQNFPTNKPSKLVMKGIKLQHPVNEIIEEEDREMKRGCPSPKHGGRKSPELFTSLAGNKFGELHGMKLDISRQIAQEKMKMETDPYEIATVKLADEVITGDKIGIKPFVAASKISLVKQEETLATGESSRILTLEDHTVKSEDVLATAKPSFSPVRRGSPENSRIRSSKPSYQIIKEMTGDDQYYDAYYQKRYQSGEIVEDGSHNLMLMGGVNDSHASTNLPSTPIINEPGTANISALSNSVHSSIVFDDRSVNRPHSRQISRPISQPPSVPRPLTSESKGLHEDSQYTIQTPTYPSVTVPYQDFADPYGFRSNSPAERLLAGGNITAFIRATSPNRNSHESVLLESKPEELHKYRLDNEDRNPNNSLSIDPNSMVPSSSEKVLGSLLQVKPPLLHPNPKPQQLEKQRQLLNKKTVTASTSNAKTFSFPSTIHDVTPSGMTISVTKTGNTPRSRRNSHQSVLSTTSRQGFRVDEEIGTKSNTPLYYSPGMKFDESLDSKSTGTNTTTVGPTVLMLSEEDEIEIEKELRDLLNYENRSLHSASSQPSLLTEEGSLLPKHLRKWKSYDEDYDSEDQGRNKPADAPPSPKEMRLPVIDQHYMDKRNPKVSAKQLGRYPNNAREEKRMEMVASASERLLSKPNKLLSETTTAVIGRGKNPFHQVRRKQVAYLPPLSISYSTSQLPSAGEGNELLVLANSLPANNKVFAPSVGKSNLNKSLK